MYKLRLKKLEIEDEEPWKQNFTLYTDRWTAGLGCNGQHDQQCFAPIWECNDPTGKCKGEHRRWAATFPAGYVIDGDWIEGQDETGKPRFGKKFVYDENFGPMMNGEYITECPYCNGEE